MKIILMSLVFGIVLTSTVGFSAVDALKGKVSQRHAQIEAAVN